jgi:hypothetical protein
MEAVGYTKWIGRLVSARRWLYCEVGLFEHGHGLKALTPLLQLRPATPVNEARMHLASESDRHSYQDVRMGDVFSKEEVVFWSAHGFVSEAGRDSDRLPHARPFFQGRRTKERSGRHFV